MPNRSSELRWESPEDPPLRTEIIDTALALADERGLAAVSIRAVADRVGMRPMSIYSYVPSKDGLLALMFDRMGTGLLVPDTAGLDGRERLAAIARASFETYVAHPWMLQAGGKRPVTGPSHLRRGEQSAQAVAQLGIPSADAWAALGLVHEWTIGHALHVITLRDDDTLRATLAAADPREHPAAAAALRAYDGDAFEEGLATVLDAIAARYAP